MIRIFDEQQIRRAVSAPDATAAIRQAFAADGRGETVVPAVINLAIPGVDGEFHVKTAYVAGMSHVAVKVASGFYDNPKQGLPAGSGLMMLFDATTGMPAALLVDNGYLTDLRTGAAGAVAADVLARAHVRRVGVIGAGVQARHQATCLHLVRRFEQLVAWSIDADGAARYAKEIGSALGVEAHAASEPEEAVQDADIVITCTPSRSPIVRTEWLRPGMHVTALGADGPGKQELDPRCLARADLVVCDRIAQCARLGELQHALAAGLIREADVTELGAVVTGKKPGRTGELQITIADLTGVGFQDTAIATLAYQRLCS